MTRTEPSVLVGLVLILGLAVTGCGGTAPTDDPAEDSADRVTVGTPEPATAPNFNLPGRDPQLRWDDAGRLHLTWVLDGEGDTPARVRYLRWENDGAFPDATFGPVDVSPPSQDVSAHGEIPPTLEVLDRDTVVVAYPVSLPGQWKGEIRFQTSTDGGVTWSEPRLLHDDERVGSHSFLTSVRVEVDGRRRAVFAWLDNRDGAQGLRVASTSDGAEITPNRTVDAVTCQCCATELLALPSAAEEDALALAYRDLTEEGVRDIRLASSPDGGATWSADRPVSDDGWTVDACPHTGPRLAYQAGANDAGTLWAAWFTGAEPGIWVAASTDRGASFGPRHAVATMGPGHSEGVRLVAHPELAMVTGPEADTRRLVVWEEARAVAGEEGTRRSLRGRLGSSTGDDWGPVFTLVEGEVVYPRVATAEDGRSVLAFTTPGPTGPRVQMTDLAPLLDGVPVTIPAAPPR